MIKRWNVRKIFHKLVLLLLLVSVLDFAGRNGKDTLHGEIWKSCVLDWLEQAVCNTWIPAFSFAEKDMEQEDLLNTVLQHQFPVFAYEKETKAVQMELFEDRLLKEENREKHKLIGQLFDTYWMVEFQDKQYMIDQHAAHEKVKYEALVKKIREGSVESQMLIPPMVMNLSAKEAHVFQEYASYFEKMGFEIEDFGGNAVTVRSVPLELFGHCEKDFLQNILDEILEDLKY